MRCVYHSPLLVRVLPPLLATEVLLGVVGNGLALWIFLFRLKPWKSSTVLLFNLTLADLLLTLVLPFRASYYFSGVDWRFGHVFCNVSLFMLAMNRSGSIFFLMAVAVDRYVRVVHPHHPLNALSVGKAKVGAATLWLVASAMTAHLLALPRRDTIACESFDINLDGPNAGLAWHKSMFLLSFFLPLVVIVFCTCSIFFHLRRRKLDQQSRFRRALWFLALVLVLYLVCFLPSNIAQLLIWSKAHHIAGRLSGKPACDSLENLNTVFYTTICLTYLNSALDPVVYYFSIPAFKKKCKAALCLGQAGNAEENTPKSLGQATQSTSQL